MWATMYFCCFQGNGPTGGKWFFLAMQYAREAGRELNIQQ